MTADIVGCSFLSAYCWNYWRNESFGRFGKNYTGGGDPLYFEVFFYLYQHIFEKVSSLRRTENNDKVAEWHRK